MLWCLNLLNIAKDCYFSAKVPQCLPFKMAIFVFSSKGKNRNIDSSSPPKKKFYDIDLDWVRSKSDYRLLVHTMDCIKHSK